MKKEELQNRREFFKRAAGRVIPALVLMSTPSTLLLSCSSGGNDDFDDGEFGGDDDNNSGENSGGNPNDNKLSKASGSIDGYEYVDLGLSVEWARYNIGASKPESYGTYLYSHTLCSDSNCYDKLLNAGFWKDNKSTSGTSYDMAKSKWGNNWRMPTRDDFEELINNCTVSYIEIGGCKGYLFTSKKNGNNIFFAAAGGKSCYKGVWETGNVGKEGCYWSGDIYISASYSGSFCLSCTENSKTGEINVRIYDDMYDKKYTIRPVSNKSGTSTGCNNNCTSSCANNSTSSSCSNCSSSCSSGCKTNCDYNCAATCASHCYGSCNDTCGGGCKYLSAGSSCSGCARTCSGRCYSACTYACSSNCQSSCVHGSK